MKAESEGRAPYKGRINPWIAQELTEAAKDAKVRATLNLYAESVIYSRSFIMGGWAMAGLGSAMMAVSVWGWVHILPLKTVENVIWVADSSTGIIAKPLSMEDAPKYFGAATEEHYLRQYVMAMERWVPEIDQEQDHISKIMSSREVQAWINDRRLKPESNQIAVGNAGRVDIENFHYFPKFVDKASDTRSYLVRYQRTVWRGTNRESSEPWSASVEFQWHPGAQMNPADRVDNPGGFVAIAYTADSDNKDNVRRK